MKGTVGRLQLKLSDDATDVDDQPVNIVMIGTAWALIIEHCGMEVSGQYDKQGRRAALESLATVATARHSLQITS